MRFFVFVLVGALLGGWVGIATTVAASSNAATTQVKIDNYTFKPATISVPVGTTVVWKNLDDEPHTVTEINKNFNSKGMAMGDTWSYRFTKPGKYTYYCTVHPFMKGTVTVEESH